MTRRTMGTYGSLLALSLTAACSSRVKNLGDDTGGAAAIGGNTSTGGKASTGGFGPIATGGKVSTGGFGPDATGGKGSTGGTESTGGIGPVATGGNGADTPYVLNPTVPIDPSCSCASPDKVCNAANQCVPRCDDAGDCVKWLATQPVADMMVQGTALYIAEQAVADPLGNPGTNGALYSVALPNGTPTLIAGHVGNPTKILGRYQNATYVHSWTTATGSIVKVGDDGAVTVLATTAYASMWGHWLAFSSADGTQLKGIDLDTTQQTVVLDSASDASQVGTTLVMQDVVVFARTVNTATSNSASICSIQLSNPTLGATCAPYSLCGSDRISTSGSQYYCATMYQIASYSPLDTLLLALYDINAQPPGMFVGKTKYLDGWLYSDLWSSYNSTYASRLARMPTSVGRLPQDILPEPIVTRHTSYVMGTGWNSTTDLVFAVSPSDVYWVQYLPPEGENKPQYIFSAPLPPKPCDADLPCADSTLVCKAGYCSAP